MILLPIPHVTNSFNFPPDTRVGRLGIGFPPQLFPPPFELIGVDGGGCDNFFVDDAGVLFTKISLDRETKAHFSCMAKSEKTGFPLSFNVVVEDENDNSPQFLRKVMNISLSETTPIQTSLSLGSAPDADVGEFTTQGYEIADGKMNST